MLFMKKRIKKTQQTLYLCPGVMWFSAGTDEAVKTLVSESCVGSSGEKRFYSLYNTKASSGSTVLTLTKRMSKEMKRTKTIK